MKHTPGPWVFVADDYNVKDDSGEHIGSIKSMDGWYICAVDGIGRQTEASANARLIAAAPDLLAALEDAHWALVHHPGGDDRAEADVKVARAAIAAARGPG